MTICYMAFNQCPTGSQKHCLPAYESNPIIPGVKKEVSLVNIIDTKYFWH